MFMHGSLLHLGGNMLFLWIFGNNIEDSMSRLRFVAFYLLGGLAATGRAGAGRSRRGGADGRRERRDRRRARRLRAAVSARARDHVVFIIIFFTIIELPALLVLGVWILIQLLARHERARAADRRRRRAAWPTSRTSAASCSGCSLIKLFANHVHEDYERAHRLPVY